MVRWVGGLLLLLCGGCLEVERIVYRFDLASRTGEVRFVGLRSSDAGSVAEDLTALLRGYLSGSKLERENPAWNVSDKVLVEEDGKLVGRVRFSFDDPRAVGLYQHDKRSPWMFCRPDSHVVSTTGTNVQDVLAGCVAWDRRARELEVSVSPADLAPTSVSLLDAWRAAGSPSGAP